MSAVRRRAACQAPVKKDWPHHTITGVVSTHCTQGLWNQPGIQGRCSPVMAGREPTTSRVLTMPPNIRR
jgi:hypothetical protein